MKTGVASAACQFALEVLTIDIWVETGKNLGVRLCRDHDPGLGFAKIGRSEACRGKVVRMDLNRERLLGVEKFEQQRKLQLRMMAAKQPLATQRYEFVQRL